MPRYSNYYPKKARPGSPRKPRAPPKKVEYEDDAEIIGLLPDDARLDLPTRTPRAASPMKFKNGTNVFKFDFEAPLAFPRRPQGMSTATATTNRRRLLLRRRRRLASASETPKKPRMVMMATTTKRPSSPRAMMQNQRFTDAQEAAGTKRRKLRV
ncbi:hypothetical protein EXIGLDRAFT_735590 [Exidia glandulosa HHB12029]|uniref:Uncharacterized protein n=1 Tax=Exidia glandulosa HHB12029 TaxID=1314781 RepID=A0A165JT16_EXIGL|nr:hypothetical protein EXIGLDRAFT_735590 [Exidia glandulosa HHB12029]